MIRSRKEWGVEDLTRDMQRRMCEITQKYHKSEKELKRFREEHGSSGDGAYLTRSQLREKGLAFCDIEGRLTMVEGHNWARDPMATDLPSCPDPPDRATHDPYERVITFHAHPFGGPIASRRDIVNLLQEYDEQITCVGGGTNDAKKVYCYEKPSRLKAFPKYADLKYIDYANAKYRDLKENLRKNVVGNDRFELAFEDRGLYPFDVYAEYLGEYVNELKSTDLINIYVSDDYDKHFEALPDWRSRVATIARNRVLEDEKIVRVHRFVCSEEGDFFPDAPEKGYVESADRYEERARLALLED